MVKRRKAEPWAAEYDVAHLVEAKKIENDPQRLNAASKKAGEMHGEKLEEAKHLKRIAKKHKKKG